MSTLGRLEDMAMSHSRSIAIFEFRIGPRHRDGLRERPSQADASLEHFDQWQYTECICPDSFFFSLVVGCVPTCLHRVPPVYTNEMIATYWEAQQAMHVLETQPHQTSK
jgi:hypothetical protein